MKKSLIFLFFLFGTPVFAQLNSFQEGDVLSAEKMNENFEYLEQQFRGARATTVNCAAGETINEAIENGFSDITVSGTCAENLVFGITNPNFGYSGQLIPRFLRLSGTDSSAKITDTSNNTQKLIMIQGGATVLIEDLTLEGGDDGVVSAGNSDLTLNDVIIEGFTARGVYITDSSNLDSYTNLTIKGAGQGTGLSLCGGSFGSFTNASISKVDTGILVNCDAALYGQSFSISANDRGISVQKSKFQKHTNGLGSIEGTSDKAINVSNGIFASIDGNLEIKNLNGGRGINLWQSQADINNLKMPDFNNKGSGDNPAIGFSDGSNVGLGNIEISGSTDGGLFNCDKSILNIQNLNISGNSDDALVGFFGCKIWMTNTEITGEANTLLDIGSSEIKIKNTSVTGKSNDSHLVYIGGNSGVSFRENSTITASEKNGIFLSGLSSLDFRDSTLSAKASTLKIEENSLATIRNSSVNAADGYGVEVVRGSGLRIYAPSTILATNDPAILARQAAWVEINDGQGTTINRTDLGSDISIRSASFMAVGEGNQIEDIECSLKSVVQADEGTVSMLDPSCTE